MHSTPEQIEILLCENDNIVRSEDFELTRKIYKR